MKKEQKKHISKWNAYGLVLVFFSVISIAMYGLSGYVTYPTDKHRQVTQEYNELSTKQWASGNPNFDDPRLKELGSSPEVGYSNIATGVTLIAQIAVWVAMVGYAYNYLRRKRVGKNPVVAVAAIDALSVVLFAIPMLYLAPLFGYPSVSTISGLPALVEALIALPFTAGFSMLIAYLVARIFQWRYNKKHSMIVEE